MHIDISFEIPICKKSISNNRDGFFIKNNILYYLISLIVISNINALPASSWFVSNVTSSSVTFTILTDWPVGAWRISQTLYWPGKLSFDFSTVIV